MMLILEHERMTERQMRYIRGLQSQLLYDEQKYSQLELMLMSKQQASDIIAQLKQIQNERRGMKMATLLQTDLIMNYEQMLLPEDERMSKKEIKTMPYGDAENLIQSYESRIQNVKHYPSNRDTH